MLIKEIKILAVLACVLSAIGCAPSIQYTTETFAALDPSIQSKQEIDNISIELNVLPDKEYEKSYYKQTINVFQSPLFGQPGLYDAEESFSDYFAKSTPFEVTIVNNTNHILRMRDARIVYIDPNSDEPKMALDKQTISEDIQSQLPSYKTIYKRLAEKYRHDKPSHLNEQITTALKHVTSGIEFVNGFNKEIMPGMRIRGIVAFPIETKVVAQGKVSFIDMVSETDAAGNPTKKVRFDYRVATIDKFYKRDPMKDKAWVEIKKEEYDTRPPK
jgi:hypothetical protein